MVAGAHRMAIGIHSGLVMMISISIQKHKPIKRNKRLDCRNISSITIMENNKNLRMNFAVLRALPLCYSYKLTSSAGTHI
jgi:hypothetical protein